jgi:hypothetical protein
MLADSAMRFPGTLIPLLAIGGGLLIPIVAIVAYTWRRMRQMELEIGLKNEMIAHGMSAEDIERVIRASSPTEFNSCSKHRSYADSGS